MSGRLRECDLQASVNQLREMFPQHSPATIERILRSQKGVIDAAISVILETPEDFHGAPPVLTPPVMPHPQAMAPPVMQAPAQPIQPPRREQPRTNTNTRQTFEHIFPPDFLRWPADAEVICENVGGPPLVPQGPIPMGMPPMGPPPQMPQPVFNVQPMQPQSGEQRSWWEKFKGKISGKKKSYERLG